MDSVDGLDTIKENLGDMDCVMQHLAQARASKKKGEIAKNAEKEVRTAGKLARRTDAAVEE